MKKHLKASRSQALTFLAKRLQFLRAVSVTSKVFRPMLSFVLLIIFVPLSVNAATTSDKQSISIAPFLKEVKITSEAPTESFNISVSNDSKKSQEINLSVLNFGSLDETGGVAFTGDNASRFSKKYGLAKWLHLERDKITVAPNETVSVRANVVNDQTMSPGGHYGAIIASVKGSEGSGKNKVSVTQKLSSLIFATKLGGEKYDLKLSSVSHNGNLWHAPDQVEARFHNPGNVHVVPRGIVKLLRGNTVYAQGVMNQESGFILPETYRQFSVTLNSLKPISPGLINSYKLQVDYRYDGIDRFATKTYEIRFISRSLVFLLLSLAFVTFVVYRWDLLKKTPQIKTLVKKLRK